MKSAVNGEFELDDDSSRVDLDALWSFLSQRAYWQRWRRRDDVERQVAGSWRVLGVYRTRDGAMVGFARVITAQRPRPGALGNPQHSGYRRVPVVRQVPAVNHRAHKLHGHLGRVGTK